MMSQRDSTSEGGFSLVEVLVAISILAAVSVLSFSTFTRPKTASTPEAVGREVTRLLQSARLQAIASRATVEAIFDFRQRRVSLNEKGFVIRFPDAMQLSLETGQHLVESVDRGSIAFYSDGSSSGGKLELKMNSLPTLQVDVPWLTGIPRLQNMPNRP